MEDELSRCAQILETQKTYILIGHRFAEENEGTVCATLILNVVPLHPHHKTLVFLRVLLDK